MSGNQIWRWKLHILVSMPCFVPLQLKIDQIDTRCLSLFSFCFPRNEFCPRYWQIWSQTSGPNFHWSSSYWEKPRGKKCQYGSRTGEIVLVRNEINDSLVCLSASRLRLIHIENTSLSWTQICCSFGAGLWFIMRAMPNNMAKECLARLSCWRDNAVKYKIASCRDVQIAQHLAQ